LFYISLLREFLIGGNFLDKLLARSFLARVYAYWTTYCCLPVVKCHAKNWRKIKVYVPL